MEESLGGVERKLRVWRVDLLWRLRDERVPVVAHVLHELVHGAPEFLLERLLRLVQVRGRLGEHVDEGHPRVIQRFQLREFRRRRRRVHALQRRVDGAQRCEPRVCLLLRLHDLGVRVHLGGEFVEVGGRGDERLGVAFEMFFQSLEFVIRGFCEQPREALDPLLAVRFQRGFKRRAVDAEEEQVSDAVLARHLLGERAVPFDVRLEIDERLVGFAVANDELVLVRLPHVPVGRLPPRHERRDWVDDFAEAVVDGDDLLERGVFIVGDDVVERG